MNYAAAIRNSSKPTQPSYGHTTDDLDHMLGFFGNILITRHLWAKVVRDGYHKRPLIEVKDTYHPDMSPEDFLGMTLLDWMDVEDRMKCDASCDISYMRNNRMEAYIKFGNISLEQAIAAIGAIKVAQILRDYLEDNVRKL